MSLPLCLSSLLYPSSLWTVLFLSICIGQKMVTQQSPNYVFSILVTLAELNPNSIFLGEII